MVCCVLSTSCLCDWIRVDKLILVGCPGCSRISPFVDNGASFTNDDKAAVLSLCSEPPPAVHSWVTLMVVVGFAIMFMISAAIVINSVSNIVGVPSVQVFEGGGLFSGHCCNWRCGFRSAS